MTEVPRRQTANSPDPEVIVESTSHTHKGCNYMMMTLTHTGTTTRQHRGIALDYSGSMSELVDMASKTSILIKATEIALKQMNDDDMVTVVVYGSHAECVMEKVRVGNPQTIPTIVKKLKQHDHMGCTNPGAALQLLKECDQTLILSDGQFNEGPTDVKILHSITNHSLLCGSIFPGTDMNDLADISDGTYFNLNCNDIETMQNLLASSLAAPPIKLSNVSLVHNDTTYNLPCVRAGCSARYVFPVLGDLVKVSYMDDMANMVTMDHIVTVTGHSDKYVQHVLTVQNATDLAEEALRTNNTEMRAASVSMFQFAGLDVKTDEDMKRVSSSQRRQFSIEPGSIHCPQICRDASQVNTVDTAVDTIDLGCVFGNY